MFSFSEAVLRHLKNLSDVDEVLFDLLADGDSKVSVQRFWSVGPYFFYRLCQDKKVKVRKGRN